MNKHHIDEIRAFNRFYTSILGLLDNHILDSKYSLPEVRIMFEIHNNPGSTASDIISLTDIDKGYLSRILKRFEKQKQKIILKTVSATDKRISTLKLTKWGEKEFEQLNIASENQLKKVFSHLSYNDFESIVKNMQLIKKTISKYG